VLTAAAALARRLRFGKKKRDVRARFLYRLAQFFAKLRSFAIAPPRVCFRVWIPQHYYRIMQARLYKAACKALVYVTSRDESYARLDGPAPRFRGDKLAAMTIKRWDD